jgi:hypothetical protein
LNLSEAIVKIQTALSAVTHWRGEPDEELRKALLEGFRAASELSAPEGTTSQGAKPRRDRLESHRFLSMIVGLAAYNEPLEYDPVAVARAAAWLGGVSVKTMWEDFFDARDHRKVRQKGGKNRGGYELEEIRQGWINYAKLQAEKSPDVGAMELARKIYRDKKGLNRISRAVGTINNYLGANRSEWDPSHR